MHQITLRQATAEDAQGIAQALHEIFLAGLRRSDATEDFVLRQYINDPDRILAQVGVSAEGRILGLQSLKLAVPGNPYGTPPGWGIIGTHIAPDAHRQGLGRRFFEASLRAAQATHLPAIEAGVGVDLLHAQAYYAAMGFESYRQEDDTDFKAFYLPES